MKKLISIMLCAFLLVGVMSVSAFAEGTETDIDLSALVTTAPVIDGTISENEYTQVYSVTVEEGDDDFLWGTPTGKEARVLFVDAPYAAGLRGATWALAADADYLYVAASITTDGAAPFAQFYITAEPAAIDWPSVVSVRDGDSAGGNAVWSFEEVNATFADSTYVMEGKIARSNFGEAEEIYFLSRAFFNGNGAETFLFFGESNESGGWKVLFVNDTPVDDTPADDTPVDDTPADDTPADDTPADDTPTDDTDAPADDEAKDGCGSSIAAMGVALVATLGTCAVFVGKKKED